MSNGTIVGIEVRNQICDMCCGTRFPPFGSSGARVFVLLDTAQCTADYLLFLSDDLVD